MSRSARLWARFKAYWTERGVVPRWQYLLVYLTIVAAGALGLNQTTHTAHRSARAAAIAARAAFSAKAAAAQSKRAVGAVQASRREQCRASNRRHDRLTRLLAPSLRDADGRSRRQARLFVSYIAPKRDC